MVGAAAEVAGTAALSRMWVVEGEGYVDVQWAADAGLMMNNRDAPRFEMVQVCGMYMTPVLEAVANVRETEVALKTRDRLSARLARTLRNHSRRTRNQIGGGRCMMTAGRWSLARSSSTTACMMCC